MTVRLSPELEALIREDIARGPYSSVEEFVEQAVQLLHEQEQWLGEHRAEVAAQVEHGYAQAERGELVDSEEAMAILRRRETRR